MVCGAVVESGGAALAEATAVAAVAAAAVGAVEVPDMVMESDTRLLDPDLLKA